MATNKIKSDRFSPLQLLRSLKVLDSYAKIKKMLKREYRYLSTEDT